MSPASALAETCSSIRGGGVVSVGSAGVSLRTGGCNRDGMAKDCLVNKRMWFEKRHSEEARAASK